MGRSNKRAVGQKQPKRSTDGRDVFISYAGSDRAWAEWAAWHLEEAGYSVELDVRDWSAGENVALRMNDAVESAGRILMLWSPAYFERTRFTTDEWTAPMAERPGERPRLVPVRVAEVDPPILLKPLAYRDVYDVDEDTARARLVEAVSGTRDAQGRPEFPGTAKRKRSPTRAPRLPGVLPTVWNVPRRSPLFTGRDASLIVLRERLSAGRAAVVQALHGMGGVGKTTLAIEYAHRFAGTYELVWWIDAEQPGLIGDQFTALGVAAGWVSPDAPTADPLALVRQRLRTGTSWLLVFDNANRREDLRAWVPEGHGHVLVTSRNPGWSQLAEPLPLPEFTRPESLALLRRSLPDIADESAGELADRLGDLPLAVAQAAQWLSETGMPIATYLEMLDKQTALVLSKGAPDGYPAPLAAVVETSLRRLADEDEAAVQLLTLCAFLAPEPIPLTLFTATPEALPLPLSDVAAMPMEFAETIRRIGAYGIGRLAEGTVQLHRLTQAIIRADVDPAARPGVRERLESVIAAAQPDDGRDPAHWPAWTRLLPHLTVLDPASSTHHGLRELACSASSYLISRAGDMRASRDFCEFLYTEWRKRLGPDHPHTLFAGTNLAITCQNLGLFADAHRLDLEIYDRRRRVLGDDHPDTLTSANNLAADLVKLGRYGPAEQLQRQTYEHRRRMLGDDHPHTLASADNLAGALAALGRLEEADSLGRDTYKRTRRLLGDDHPDTLKSASNLANDLSRLGRVEESEALARDAYERYRRVLGDDHPDTLAAASNLAAAVGSLGRVREAEQLYRQTSERRRRLFGDDHPDTLFSTSNLAAALSSLGRTREAEQLHRDALNRTRRVLGDGHPVTLEVAEAQAEFLLATGRPGQARKLMQWIRSQQAGQDDDSAESP